MTINGWERDEINEIHRRVKALEDFVKELDARTAGSIRLGPKEPSHEEMMRKAEEIGAKLLAASEKARSVDRSQQTLTDGSPVPADRSHTQDRGDGQQKGYVVLSPEERAKGFIRPVRQSYIHKKCGVVTHMGLTIAETYARDPHFYNGTFCVGCRAHFPLDQFRWDGTDEQVGS